MSDLQGNFIRLLKEKVPKGINPVNLLTEIIPIKKEGAYLRLRGMQPFTFDEVIKIAEILKISMDDILNSKVSDTYKMGLIRLNSAELYDEYRRMNMEIIETAKIMQLHPDSQLSLAQNRILFTHLLRYPTLSKFRVFKHYYQYRKDVSLPKMSEIVIPTDIRDMEIQIAAEFQKVKILCMWTKDIFEPYVADILYFSEIGLLTRDEVCVLKEEMQSLLDTLAQSVLHGKMESGVSFTAYLLNTYLDANYTYIQADQFRLGAFSLFGINFHSSTNPQFCDNMKEWISSLLKYSVLISKSGAVHRTNFFKRQQNILNTINP